MTSTWLAAACILAIALRLAFVARASRAKAARAKDLLVASIAKVVPDAVEVPAGTVGVATFAGTWRGLRVQIRTIVDTLATRKLPACWLSVSVTEKVAVPGTFDMMMRPRSPTTFSNFDLLPYALPPFPGFPAEAVARTDSSGAIFPREAISRGLGFFADPRVKELLITPNGVRIVRLLAEADRARYGVFRQAEFTGVVLDPDMIEGLLRSASSLRDAINSGERQAA